MATSNKSYQPLLPLTIEAKEDLQAFRFVSHLGSLCADAGRALGVTDVDWLNGQYASVTALGTIAVETATTINIGDDITSAANGKARPAGGSEPVNGRALSTAGASEFVKIKLVP